MFYALVDASALGFRLTPDEGRDIVRLGEMVKAAAREQIPVAHPEQPELAGISIIELTGPPTRPGRARQEHGGRLVRHARLARPESFTGVLDRSPCGTGTCARMAVLHARGQLAIGQDFVHEGILGTTWTGRLLRETTVGSYPAVVPQLTGSAWITGRADTASMTTTRSPTASPWATCGVSPTELVAAADVRLRARIRMDP